MMNGWLAVLAAYLIGGIPFGFLLVRWKSGKDVRSMGSGNIGATNVLRTAGRTLGVITLLLDMAKGAFAVWLADHLTHRSSLWMAAAALAVVLGHVFPVFLKFKGGKAVASFVGAFLYLTPVPLLATTLIFIATVAYSKHISMGSIVGAVVFPFGVWIIEHPPWPVVAAAVLGSLIIIWRHKSNIERIRAGTENVFSFGGKR